MKEIEKLKEKFNKWLKNVKEKRKSAFWIQKIKTKKEKASKDTKNKK